MDFKRLAKDFAIGISLANVTLLRVWSELLSDKTEATYTMRHATRPVDFVAAMLNVILLGTLLFVAATIARRSHFGRSLLPWGLVVYLVMPLNALRTVVANAYLPSMGGELFRDSGRVGIVACALVGTTVCAVATARWRLRVAHAASAILLAISPFVLLTFGKAAVGIAHYDETDYADRRLATPVQVGELPRRVLWIIFDEMDERLTFINRDPHIRLPELDRFRSESFSASAAHTPARITLQSMPALITGRPVDSAREVSPTELLVGFEGGAPVAWQYEDNVFSRARREGIDSGLAGWYHPYCRVLNDSLTACSWGELSNLSNSTGKGLARVVANQARSLVETSLLSPFGQSLVTQHHVRTYQSVLSAGKAYATDPHLGMVMIHFPIPHPPYIYNARTGRLDRGNSPVGGYADSLELADRSLGELRKAMETAGLWDRTAVLISADHGYRGNVSVDGGKIADRWVPFLLKLPGNHNSYRYDHLLETVRSSDLLLEVLRGRLTGPNDVAGWLDGAQIAHARPGQIVR